MSKVKRIIIFAFFLVLLFQIRVDATDIRSVIPNDVLKEYNLDRVDINDPAASISSFSFRNILQIVVDSIKKFLPESCTLLFSILGIVLLFSLLEHFSLAHSEKNHHIIVSYIGNAAMLLMLYHYFANSCALVEESLSTIRVFCDASVPIITALLISSGKSFGASVFSYGISLCGSLISALSITICIPLIRIFMMIGSCATIWQDIHFSSITDLIKKFIKWAIGIVFSVFSFTLSVQSILSGSADNLAKKALKGAAGTIPFMGSVLSQGLDGAFMIASGTKTASAVVGAGVIIMIFIGPAILIALQAMALYLSVATASFFGQKNCLSILKTMYDVYILLLGLFLVSVLMCIINFLIICLGMS